VVRKSQQELEAIKRAFGKKDLPQHAGVKSGGGTFSLTAAERRAYDAKKKRVAARAGAVA
jgi:hypothetical protein